jgi:hypothetical protein
MLYKQILGLGLLIGLNQLESFVVILLLLVLIFAIAIYAIRTWYLNNQIGEKTSLADIQRRNTFSGIEIEIPNDCTFRTASTALAKTEKFTIKFVGFTETELNTFLVPQAISAKTTVVALERFRDIASAPLRSYTVTKGESTYELAVI